MNYYTKKFIIFVLLCASVLSDFCVLNEIPPLRTFVRQLLDEYRVAYPEYYRLENYCKVSSASNSCSRTEIGLLFIDILYDFIDDESARLSNSEYWTCGLDQELIDFYDSVEIGSTKRIAMNDMFLWTQKKLIALGDAVYFIGDLHGDMRSLLLVLLDLQEQGVLRDDYTLASDHYLVFTGDYIDRGPYSLDVFALVLYLKLKNPEHVILLRGNHEEHTMSVSDAQLLNIAHMFEPDDVEQREALLRDINKVFNLLPCALYIGVEQSETHHIDYIMAAHAGLELSYCPRAFLESSYQCDFIDWSYAYLQNLNELRAQRATALLHDSISPQVFNNAAIGFLWGDFLSDEYKNKMFGPASTRLNIGLHVVRSVFEDYCKNLNATIHMLVRGHQHELGYVSVTPDCRVYTVVSCFEMLCNLARRFIGSSQNAIHTCYIKLATGICSDQWAMLSKHIEYNSAKHTFVTRVEPLGLPESLRPDRKMPGHAFTYECMVGEQVNVPEGEFTGKSEPSLLCEESPLTDGM